MEPGGKKANSEASVLRTGIEQEHALKPIRDGESRVRKLEDDALVFKVTVKWIWLLACGLGVGILAVAGIGLKALSNANEAEGVVKNAITKAKEEIEQTVDRELKRAIGGQLKVLEGNVRLQPRTNRLEVFFETGSLENPVVIQGANAGYGPVSTELFWAASTKQNRKGIRGSIVFDRRTELSAEKEHEAAGGKDFNLAYWIFQPGATSTNKPILAERFE